MTKPESAQVMGRITTQFIEQEDRIRLNAEMVSLPAQSLMLTRRLLRRFLPHALKWLEQKPLSTQITAQIEAAHSVRVQPPVKPENAVVSLVHEITLQTDETKFVIVFRTNELPPSVLTLTASELRVWLHILHQQCLRAEWNDLPWPNWFSQAQASVIH